VTRARAALHAEWTKQRTLPGTAWLLALAATLIVALSAAAVAATTCRPGAECPVDTAKLSLTGVQFGQAVVAVLAVLALGGEYSTGMIRTTLTAIPRRSTVLAAKAVTVAVPVLAMATVAVLGSLLAARLLLPGRGLPAMSLSDGAVLRAAVGSVLYLALIALLSLGLAAAVRDSAVSVGLVLGLLYLFPIVAAAAANPRWQRRLEQIGPMNAGLEVQATTNLHSLAISPWGGLGVLAAWSAAALLAGGLLLRLRDA
jgi:ABC-2 type transport system permease protein